MKPSVSHFKSRIIRRSIEVLGVLFAIFLAAILGNHVARIVTKPIDNPLAIYAVGIIIGLLIGILVGIYFKRGWSKLLHRLQQ